MITKEAQLFIARFASGEFTAEEHRAFLKWLETASAEDLEAIADEYESVEEDAVPAMAGPGEAWIEQLEQKLDLADRKARRGLVRRMWDQRYVRRTAGAAAIVSAVIAGGLIKLYVHPSGPGSAPSQQAGVLSYTVAKGKGAESKTLPDGSVVWLNTASSLTCPRAFTGSDRTVELSGEAYFKVAKNVSQPFRVKVRDMEIEVLGTEFNVKAYGDEAVGSTSLLEGSVSITRGSEKVILKKGQLAEIDYSSTAGQAIRVGNAEDPEKEIAWVNGMLEFKNDGLESVMSEIGRNYDLNIEYVDKGKMPAKHFSGKFARTYDIHQVLKELEFQHIHTKIEGATIKVVP
jgi:ferric-dicitrate binding protein FerR (iron transport regulator)